MARDPESLEELMEILEGTVPPDEVPASIGTSPPRPKNENSPTASEAARSLADVMRSDQARLIFEDVALLEPIELLAKVAGAPFYASDDPAELARERLTRLARNFGLTSLGVAVAFRRERVLPPIDFANAPAKDLAYFVDTQIRDLQWLHLSIRAEM